LLQRIRKLGVPAAPCDPRGDPVGCNPLILFDALEARSEYFVELPLNAGRIQFQKCAQQQAPRGGYASQVIASKLPRRLKSSQRLSTLVPAIETIPFLQAGGRRAQT